MMSKRTLKALQGSIKKWEAIVAEEGEDHGPTNCPLCQLYNNGYKNGYRNGYNSSGDGCSSTCPIKKRTGLDFCEGSPYDQWVRIHWDGDGEGELGVAKDMLIFLRSLLPE